MQRHLPVFHCSATNPFSKNKKATEDMLATFFIIIILYLIKITSLGTFCLIYDTPLMIFLYNIWVTFTVLFSCLVVFVVALSLFSKVKCNEKTKCELPIEMYRTELVTQNSCFCISFFLQRLFLWDTEQSSG